MWNNALPTPATHTAGSGRAPATKHRRRGQRASSYCRLPVVLPAVYGDRQERLQTEREEVVCRNQGGEGARVAIVRCEQAEQECGARRIHGGVGTAVKNQSRSTLLSSPFRPESPCRLNPDRGGRRHHRPARPGYDTCQ